MRDCFDRRRERPVLLKVFGSRLTVGIIALLVLASLAGGCGTSRSSLPDYPLSGKSYEIGGERYDILADAEGYSEYGQASWYGDDFHGKPTASGEIYDMMAMTAAHKTLPLQSIVRVTNLANGRRTAVRINDRGPFAKGRIIDLSLAAAQRLNMVNAGVAPVLVEVIGVSRSKARGRFTVQVAAYNDRRIAEALSNRLQSQYGPVHLQVHQSGRSQYYRVRVGDTTDVNKAKWLKNRLEKQGFKDCFLVALS